VRFGKPEGDAPGALEAAEDEFLFLLFRAPLVEHGDEGEVADDRMLVLQVIVQPEASPRKMLADHRHPEVAAVLPAITLGGGEAPMAGLVGAAGGFLEQFLPLLPGQTARLEVRPRIFAAVVEEADVVVLRFKRLDLGGDEGVEFGEIGLQVGGDGEVHQCSPIHFWRAARSAGYLGTSTASLSSASRRSLASKPSVPRPMTPERRSAAR